MYIHPIAPIKCRPISGLAGEPLYEICTGGCRQSIEDSRLQSLVCTKRLDFCRPALLSEVCNRYGFFYGQPINQIERSHPRDLGANPV